MTRVALVALGMLIGLGGCAGVGDKTRKPEPVPQQVPSLRERLRSHVEGVWETSGAGGKTQQVIFARGGQLTFKNGLEKYNPAAWSIDEGRQELDLTFPSVSLEAMQIFQTYVGQGVKTFHPQQRKVTYAFTPDTWTLNIAGWEYTKPDTRTMEPLPPEPVFRPLPS